MPRLARLDAPGVLHHVMGRGIERRKIFLNDIDRKDFIDRMSLLVENGGMEIYAWVLMPNHFHLLCKTKKLPLASSMRRILTGYVVNFNKRHLQVKLRENGRTQSTCCLFFGNSKNRRKNYLRYVKKGIDQGSRPELVGGGLIRSLGGWAAVLSSRRRGERQVADQRILGDGDFVKQVISGLDDLVKKT